MLRSTDLWHKQCPILGCLPLKCLLQIRTARINNGSSATSRKCPTFLPLKRWSSSASGASLLLALGDASCLAPTPCRQWGHVWEGVITRENVPSHVHISPPLCFVLKLRLQKGRHICGTLYYGRIKWTVKQVIAIKSHQESQHRSANR